MARRFREELTEWSKGAIPDLPAAKCPPNASPRARNTAWVDLGFPARRKGCSILTQTGETINAPATERPAILGLGNFNDINWVISDQGRWSKIVSGAFAPIDAAVPTPFTVGEHVPSTAIANGHLFAVNGTNAKKTDGTVITNFGLVRSGAPTVTDEGTAGNPSGTYRVALTRFNSVTGHESSRSVFGEVTVTSKKIKAAFPANAFTEDTQTTHIRVHIFKVGLSGEFFRLTATNVTPNAGSFDATHGGYTSATSFVTIDVTDTNITNLIVKSPSESENNPPPTGTKFIAHHGSRMWATDGVNLFYSKIDQPESFNPDNFEPVNPNNGQDIISFGSDSDERLVILKELSSYVLSGPDDPNQWEINPLSEQVGTRASRTLVKTERGLWWAAAQGFFSKPLGSLPERMDQTSIGNHTEEINFSHRCVAAYDVVRQRIVFAVPGDVPTRNVTIFPYNTRLNIWEDIWDPMDVSALGTFIDPITDTPFVAIGNYKGRVFRLWDTPYVDGVRIDDGVSVFFTLEGTVGSVTADTLTDPTATFDTLGDGLSEIPILAISPDGVVIRNIIKSNTATVLTLNDNWDTLPESTWTYVIGSPNFEFETRHMSPTSNPVSGGSEFNTRDFKRLMLKGFSDTGSATLTVFSIIDENAQDFGSESSISLSGTGALFDIDLWDASVFGQANIETQHRTIGKRGRTCGLKVVNRKPNSGTVILGMGLLGTEHTFKK